MRYLGAQGFNGLTLSILIGRVLRSGRVVVPSGEHRELMHGWWWSDLRNMGSRSRLKAPKRSGYTT